MDDFKKHLEYGQKLKGGGIRFERQPLNRVDEVLNGFDSRSSRSTPPVMPELNKIPNRTESVPLQNKRVNVKRNWSKVALLIFILLILLAGISYGGYKLYGYYEYRQLLTSIEKKTGPLPNDEDPTISTILKPEAFSGQEFFKGVQVGDKLLIYHNHKVAILYRPSSKEVINIAPITK